MGAEIFLFLHIAFMFAGVAAADGMGFLVMRIARSTDLAAIQTGFHLYEPIARITPLFFVAGLVFGVISIFTIGFNPFEPWLLIAYALFLIQLVLGVAVADRWQRRVREAAARPDADPNSGDLGAVLGDPVARNVAWVQTALVAVFIFDMVVKPFTDRGI
ncbi:MAG: DUF2269 family protein [Chloroflexota bacterium]|nr:DUF2269 family protein [Chloroflexota bacterium]